MCTSDNQTLRKRPLEDTAFISIDGSHQMTNPLKKHCTTSDNPSCISLMKATILQRRRQAQADEAVKADQVSSESKPSNAEETLLEEEFQPGPWHVIYGREKIHKEHIGNKRLRVLIANNLKAYVEAPSRRGKSKIIDDVASQIRCYGGFVKKTSKGRWLSIGPVQSREKVGHSFRDCMKLFKGNKPESKQIQWTEAQNAIFTNLNLRGFPPSSPVTATVTPSRSPSPLPAPVRSVSVEPLNVYSLPEEGLPCDPPAMGPLDDVEPLAWW